MIAKSKYAGLVLLTAFVFCLFGTARADVVSDRIARLNQTLKAYSLPWQAGRTSVSDLSLQQRRALLGGPDEPLDVGYSSPDTWDEFQASGLPYSGGASASWDWRNVGGINWMTPVTNQMCGDCWAHATMGSMEVRLRWQRGGTYGYELPINLSERYAVTCGPHPACSSYNIPGLLNFVKSDGVTDEECLPYNPALTCADRCANWSNRVYKVTNHGRYDGPGATFVRTVKNSCETFGPIPVWMMVYSDFWDYSGGIYIKSPTATAEGGHFVNIVGWGTSGSVPYWICKNSWGTGWGIDGYFLIRQGTNESRMEEQAYWLTPQLLPNLDDSTPTGWDYPIVPRGDNTAAGDNCHVSSTLPGNSNSTYWNVSWQNEGTVMARDNVTHLTIDGIYRWWFSVSPQPAGYQTRHLNYGTENVRGGRHTICLDTIDYDNRVWEYDERDNVYCRQFVWSPYGLAKNTPLTRSSAPPRKDSPGYSWYNTDGFSFLAHQVHPDDWWSAVGILPSNSAADYDVRLYDIGTYTGSQGGFGSSLQTSSYGGSASDFVIVNDNNAVAGTYYAGALNWNNRTGAFRIEEDTSEKIFLRPGTQWNGPWSKIASNVLDIYEVYLTAGEYFFLLDQTSGTCDLGMTLYDKATVTGKKSSYVSGSYANSNGDGEDESFQITLAESGFYGLVVWKVDSSDYAKTSTYRLAVGAPSINVTSPNGGEIWNVGESYDIRWNTFGDPGSSVRIDVSRDGGSTWSNVVASTSNDGVHPWTVTAPGSTQCRVRVRSTTETSYVDMSNSNFTIYNDLTAPTPNPMTWATVPYETSTSSICMLATTASDDSPPIAYYFDFISSPTGGSGGTDSGWQSSPTYTDTGLEANHRYVYKVKACDCRSNETALSIRSLEFTDIETPTGITFGDITVSSIQAKSTNTPSGLRRRRSGLLIQNVTGSTESGWKQNNAFWTSSGLSPNTRYNFRAKARNGDGNQTSFCGVSRRYTLAKRPVARTFSNVTQNRIRARWGANGNPAGTEYLCENTTTGSNSGWTTARIWNDTGLAAGTTYNYRVKARNGDGTETAWLRLGLQATLP